MWSHLERGSSPVDWCESNYSISPMIAEFVNTVSNILFFLFPPVLIHLFQEYAKFVNPAIHFLWIMLMVVGLSSAYFHATLSLFGQLLDEMAILWVMVAAFAMFFPRRHFPNFLGGNRFMQFYFWLVTFLIINLLNDIEIEMITFDPVKALGFYCSIFLVISTAFLVMHPFANAFALMAMASPATVLLYKELSRVKCARVRRLGLRSMCVFFVAVVCWIVDRLFCSAWESISFPYLHGVWHVLSFIASYTSLVLFAYFNVSEERPEQKPVLKYWPRNDFELGVPYISVTHPRKKDEDLAI